VLAALLVVTAVAPVAAIARVTSLKVSTTRDESGATRRLPLTTEVAYVLFDYEGAANDRLTVSLQGLGLSSIVAKSSSYNGSGSAVVEIAGVEILRSLTRQLSGFASQVHADVKLAADQELGRRGYLEAVDSNVRQVERVLMVLGSMALPAAVGAQVDAVMVTADDLSTLAEEAMSPSLDDAGRRAKAEAMKAPAAALIVSVERLAESADAVASAPYPPTGENAPLTVQVSVGGMPSVTDEIWVVQTASGPLTEMDPTEAAALPGVGGPLGATAVPTRAGAATAAGADRPSSAAGADVAGRPTTGVAGGMPPRAASTPVSSAGGTTVAHPGTPIGLAAAEDRAAADALAMAERQGLTGPDAAEGGLGAAQPLPTWTVPALAVADGAGPAVQPLAPRGLQSGGSGGTQGPSLLVLGSGALLLVGLAFWLRRRTQA